MSRASSYRTIRLLAIVGVAGFATTAVFGDQADSESRTPAEKSAALSAAPNLTFDPSAGLYVAESAIRARAEQVMPSVPFPPNRNSAASLDWGRQGALTEGDVQHLVQVNAMCDWVAYVADAAESGDARLREDILRVMRDVPRWPAVRDLPFVAQLREAVRSLESGDWRPMRDVRDRWCTKPVKDGAGS